MKIKKKFFILIIIIILITIYAENKNVFTVQEFGEIKVYFCPKTNCSNIINEEINASNKTYCAFYDLDFEEINTEKINEFLIDENNYKNKGIKIQHEGLMHHKFCVIDDKKIITGSFNPTKNNKNDNNLIIIESKILAKNYLSEFEKIKNSKNKKQKTNTINYNNYELKNYFCPNDNCQEKIITELLKANKSITFLTFTFTDKEIAKILIKKQKEGIKINGIMEKFQNHEYSTYKMLLQANISVKLDINPRLQHNKLFLIDNKTIITGSYNPTIAANTINNENILIINQPNIVYQYVDYINEFI